MSFLLGITGWASETPPDEVSALFGPTELGVHIASRGETAGQARLASELYRSAGPGRAPGELPEPPPKLTPATPGDDSWPARIGRAQAAESSAADPKILGKAAPPVPSAPAADGPDGQLAPLVAASGSEERQAPIERAETRAPSLPGQAGEPAQPGAGTAPAVEVRTGSHGDYERVAFEWPEGVEYDVAQRAEQVTLVFSRAGRIDLSPLRDGFGRLLVGASAPAGEVTSKVVLRLVPEASIRTQSFEDGRIVAIDLFAEPTVATTSSPSSSPERDAIQALTEALERRDEVIENLLVRVEQLERRLALSSDDLDQVVAGGAGGAGTPGSAPPLPEAAAPPAAAPEPAPAAAPTTAQQAPTPAPPSATAQQAPPPGAGQGGAPASDAPSAPGEFEVAEEDIDRALERTLVQTGVLLLPLGQAEVEPYFSYTRREGTQPVLFFDNGIPGVSNQEVRRNEFVTGQTLRVGLPFDAQVELDLPYRYVDQSVVTPTGFGQREDNDGSGFGVGDLRVGLAKTLVRENGGWWPDLVARASWDTDTGKTSDNGIALGGGYHEIRGSLSAVKRQDPLAFVGGLSYAKTFENDGVEPGNELGFSLGTVLAASPETSLRLALSQSFTDNAKVDGDTIDGSDRVIGTATFGASVVLGRGVLLDVAADVGLTDDAPDYAARASLPIRFNLPVY